MKRILPFPQPHHASTSSSSVTDALQASGSANMAGTKQGPSPSSTPGPSALQSERSSSQSGIADTIDVKASGLPSIPSGGGSNRQYRLATAGADKNVRVSRLDCRARRVSVLTDSSDLDGVPKRRHPCCAEYSANHASSASDRIFVDIKASYGSRQRRPVESEWPNLSIRGRW